MPKPVALILCVGLTQAHLGSDTPNLTALASRGFASPMTGVVPAVTTTAQTSLLTGKLPQEHGVVANGWYFRELGEILVLAAEPEAGAGAEHSGSWRGAAGRSCACSSTSGGTR